MVGSQRPTLDKMVGSREDGQDVRITGTEHPITVEQADLTPYFNSALTNTVVTVREGATRLCMIEVSNIAATDGFLQLFDGKVGQITLGTTAPRYSFFIPKGDATNRGAMDKPMIGPLYFPVGLSAAVTTTATGSTGLATAAVVNMGTR